MFGAPPESDLNFDKNAAVSMKSFLSKVEKLAAKIDGREAFSDLVASVGSFEGA